MEFNNLFKICIGFTLLLLAFSLMANFLSVLEVFPHTTNIGLDVDSNEGALQILTGLDEPNMQYIFLGVTGLTFIGAVALCYLTKQIIPIGIHLFGVIFWTSWIRMTSALGYGGYMPVELLAVFTIGTMFIFIGAIIGMLTGN